ncbi:uncharacterized protein L201_003406 [Kwoniella dendrophila CBS 6074]|uniref:Protein-tyrosine-phosphatase n=1 Tax=Kwoniella dendrophila CBS 6074 TaxID=1295534 RepID=A0AAX4JSX9_9TREE
MSKQPPGPALIQVPNLFSIVEPGVYRCATPTAAQIPFLASLNLKTIVSLTPEHPIKPLLTFIRTSGIDFIHLGLNFWRPPGTDWKPVRDEVIKAALEKYVLDIRAHPVLLIDPIGVHQTGCVVGALRMMQGWNFASTLIEYRSHAQSKHRYADEQYIELFDPDLINLPPPHYIPSWWLPYSPKHDDDDSSEEEQEEAKTVYREVNGIVPGQEGAKEHSLNDETPQDIVVQ